MYTNKDILKRLIFVLSAILLLLLLLTLSQCSKQIPKSYEEEIKIEHVEEYVDEAPQRLHKVYDALPLTEELQCYTYKVCVDNSCEEYYELVLAIMWQESRFDPAAISATNDYGIMQINRINHKWLEDTLSITDFLDAKQNIRAGVYILSKHLLKYKNESKALMAYNMGETGAGKLWKQGIYSTEYSRSILEKKEYVIQNIYL